MSRRRMSLLVCLALMGLGGVVSPTGAETTVGSSLEWLTCTSDVVAVGRIERVVTTRGPGSVYYDDCTVAVEEVIRGEVQGGRLVFCLRSLGQESPVRTWLQSRKGLLLFLSRSQDHGAERHLDGTLVPASPQFPLSVIDLSDPGRYVFDVRFRVLSDSREILDISRQVAQQAARHLKRHPGGRAEARRLEVPPSSPAWRSLYAGSACYLKAPAFQAGAVKE